jgi:Protein of unknown function (DUF2807).
MNKKNIVFGVFMFFACTNVFASININMSIENNHPIVNHYSKKGASTELTSFNAKDYSKRNIQSNYRNIDKFDSISVNIPVLVNFIQSSEHHLSIESEKNVLKNIKTSVVNGTLIITGHDITKQMGVITINITSPTLVSVVVKNGSKFIGNDLLCDDLKVNVSHHSRAQINGYIESLNIKTDKHSRVDLSNVDTEETVRSKE